MLIKQVIEAFDVLDSSTVTGRDVENYLRGIKADANIEVYELKGPKGSTDMVKVRIPGTRGKASGGDAPTIGLLGRLGGIGARPEMIGFVSDGDGALAAIALAASFWICRQREIFWRATCSFLHRFVLMLPRLPISPYLLWALPWRCPRLTRRRFLLNWMRFCQWTPPRQPCD